MEKKPEKITYQPGVNARMAGRLGVSPYLIQWLGVNSRMMENLGVNPEMLQHLGVNFQADLMPGVEVILPEVAGMSMEFPPIPVAV